MANADECLRPVRTSKRTMTIVFYLFVYLCLSCVSSFNLEPQIPIVKHGDKDSYFGFSVAQHITLRPNRESRILVGAPRAQGPQLGAPVRGGAIYDCPLTTRTHDCQRLSVEDADPLEDEMKDNQWLGVTLKSQGVGGFVMTCAHRYVKKGPEYRWGNGICYSLTENLDQDNTFDPCVNRAVQKAHEQYGYCQAGTSGVITEDNSIVIGTPGPYTWRGTIFVNSIAQGMRDDIAWYMGPVLDNSAPVDKYSYLGMSVATGKFFDGRLSYIAGAPRANNTGQVVFFTKEPGNNTLRVQLILNGEVFASSFGYEIATANLNGDRYPDVIVGAPFYYDKTSGGAIYIYMNTRTGITPNTKPIKITGKPESRFGFAIANCSDLNKDGYEDIAVGAPYENYGAVYIFLGSRTTFNVIPVQIIRSEDLPHPIRAFGHSLSGGLDLDGNKYPDLIVGAYENDTVVLLRARPIISIKTEVYVPATISPTVKGCASDTQSDLTCASFRACFQITSKEAIRSSSVIINYTIEAETFQGKKVSRVFFLHDNIESKYISGQFGMPIETTGSKTDCRTEVFYLRDNVQDILTPLHFKLAYSLIQKLPGTTRRGELPDIDSYPILDQQEASKIFLVNFNKSCGFDDICQSDLEVSASFLNAPNGVLSIGEMSTVTLEIKVMNKHDPAYEAMVYITHPESITYIQGKGVIDKKEHPCNRIDKTLITCKLDNPFIKHLNPAVITVGFSTQKVKDNEHELFFSVKANSTSVELHPKSDTVLKLKVLRKAKLEFIGVTRPDQVKYGGEIRGQRAMKNEDEIGSAIEQSHTVRNYGPSHIRSLKMKFHWPYEIENHREHGKWLLYLTHEPTVTHTYGTCTIDRTRVNPLNLMLNKVVRPVAKDVIGSEEFDSKVKSLTEEEKQKNSTYSNRTVVHESTHSETTVTRTRTSETSRTETKRQKRDAAPESQSAPQVSSKKIITFDCNRTAKCFTFDCTVHNLRPNANVTITLRARLWNSTFVSEYPLVDSVEIATLVSIEVDPFPEIDLIEMYRKPQPVITYAFPDIPHSRIQKEIPYWVYILAAVLGILLLVILILVLWKCGFFERKKPDAMMKGNIEKHDFNSHDY